MSKLALARPHPLVYLITDRLSLPPPPRGRRISLLLDLIERAFAAGVDMVQLRERDLSPREVLEIAEFSVRLARSTRAAVLVNDRADIASCTGAGVHLSSRSLTADAVRRTFGPDMLIGVSTHSYQEALVAEGQGADFIVFGPVFETSSKLVYGPPIGLDALHVVAASLTIPVLALGGIATSNFGQALQAGAAGVAGISMFSQADDLGWLVRTIKQIAS